MAKRMTKVEKIDKLLAIADVQADKVLVEYLEHEKELLSKKSTSAEKKPTKTQLENEKLKASILSEMVAGDKYTVTDVIKSIPSASGLANQKISQLFRSMVSAEELERVEEKGKAYFIKPVPVAETSAE